MAGTKAIVKKLTAAAKAKDEEAICECTCDLLTACVSKSTKAAAGPACTPEECEECHEALEECKASCEKKVGAGGAFIALLPTILAFAMKLLEQFKAKDDNVVAAPAAT